MLYTKFLFICSKNINSTSYANLHLDMQRGQIVIKLYVTIYNNTKVGNRFIYIIFKCIIVVCLSEDSVAGSLWLAAN